MKGVSYSGGHGKKVLVSLFCGSAVNKIISNWDVLQKTGSNEQVLRAVWRSGKRMFIFGITAIHWFLRHWFKPASDQIFSSVCIPNVQLCKNYLLALKTSQY